MSKRLTRRALMAGLGGTGALSLLPLLNGSKAVAQSGEIPKRVVFIHCWDGMVVNEWQPRPVAGASKVDPRNFVLGPTLETLNPYVKDMILFENLEMVSTYGDPTPPANAHEDGQTHFLTAQHRFSDKLPGAKSIDQVIADGLVANGVVTALKSLEIAVGNGNSTLTQASTGPGELIQGLAMPDQIYDRLFPASEMISASESSALQQRNERLYGFLTNEYGAMAKRLSPEDRIKLEQHADLINELEKRKLALLSGNRQDLWPGRTILDPVAGLDWSGQTEEVWADRWIAMAPVKMGLVAAALHADVTRVVSISVEAASPVTWGYTLGQFDSSDSHDFTHKVNDLGYATPQSNDPEARALLINEKTVLVGQAVKVLVDQLAELEEVDGSRLLDHTVVVLVSHIADGSHQLGNLPWFTLGNLDGQFDTGQLITLEKGKHPQDSNIEVGRGHGDLYATVANAMGVQMDKFGLPEVHRGPIEEMLA